MEVVSLEWRRERKKEEDDDAVTVVDICAVYVCFEYWRKHYDYYYYPKKPLSSSMTTTKSNFHNTKVAVPPPSTPSSSLEMVVVCQEIVTDPISRLHFLSRAHPEAVAHAIQRDHEEKVVWCIFHPFPLIVVVGGGTTTTNEKAFAKSMWIRAKMRVWKRVPTIEKKEGEGEREERKDSTMITVMGEEEEEEEEEEKGSGGGQRWCGQCRRRPRRMTTITTPSDVTCASCLRWAALNMWWTHPLSRDVLRSPEFLWQAHQMAVQLTKSMLRGREYDGDVVGGESDFDSGSIADKLVRRLCRGGSGTDLNGVLSVIAQMREVETKH